MSYHLFHTSTIVSSITKNKCYSKRSSFAYIPAADFSNKYSGYSETGYFELEWKPLVVMLVHKSTIRRMSELKSTYFVIGLPLNSWKGIHRLRRKEKSILYIKCLVRAIYGVVSFYTEVIILNRRIQKMLTTLMVC